MFHFCVQAMARVASFLDPQNKEGISAVLCSTGAMTRGQAKLRPTTGAPRVAAVHRGIRGDT